MVKGFRAEQVINGTWGEVWFDGEYLSQVTACKAEVGFKKTAITQVQSLVEGQKITGLEPKGEIKLHHINSFVMRKVSDTVKRGKTPTHTIITKLKDPDAIGAERVAFYNCVLDKMLLADWEAGKTCEETYGFTFGDWKPMQTIK